MPKPNLLFLYTDEQRFDTLAAYGNTRICMPNLNRLAAQSTVFQRSYVTQPVCTPSRSSLLTGQYPHTNGCIENNIPLRADTPCLPEMLTPGEYSCAHHGKWHLGNEVFAQHGFTEWRATDDTYHNWYGPERDQAVRSAYHHWLISHGIQYNKRVDIPEWIASRFFREQIMSFPEELSRPAFLGEESSRFIREHQNDSWVLYTNFLEPHMPFHSARDGQYAPAEVTLPGNFGHALPQTESRKTRLSAEKYRRYGYDGQQLQTEQDWRELTARYWGMCSLVDTHVGRILDALEETGQMDNTIIVFTSDHGDMMGSHGLLTKTVMFEEAVRVPLMICYPGQKQGRIVDDPVSQIDIVPTLLDMLGQPIPDTLQGISLRSLVENGVTASNKRDVVIEWTPDGDQIGSDMPDYARGIGSAAEINASLGADLRTIVTNDGWKYTWSSAGEDTLYNLNNDPLEMSECGQDPAHRDRIVALHDEISKWQERTGDIKEIFAVL